MQACKRHPGKLSDSQPYGIIHQDFPSSRVLSLICKSPVRTRVPCNRKFLDFTFCQFEVAEQRRGVFYSELNVIFITQGNEEETGSSGPRLMCWSKQPDMIGVQR